MFLPSEGGEGVVGLEVGVLAGFGVDSLELTKPGVGDK